MKKKKILHLITGLEIGGAEKMLLKILPKIQNNFDNKVCTLLKDGPVGKELRKAGIKIYHLDFSVLNSIKSILKFRKIIREFQPDILTTYLIHSDLFGRIFGQLFGIKTIICSQRGSLLNWEWLRVIDRLTKFLVTKYIVQTETAKKELMKKLNLPGNKFEIIPNSIDLKEYEFKIDKNKKKAELKINLDNLNIICVSNLRTGKGHKYLLEAFENTFCHSIASRNPAPNLLIVGDGDQKEKLLQQIKNYKSKNNIYFLGNRSDVKDILKISDIFVLPTLAEGMSNAILEAMASGLPIITTNIPENKELIENKKTGFLIPVKNSKKLADKIIYLLENDNKRKDTGERAKNKIAENFETKKVIKKMATFYNSI